MYIPLIAIPSCMDCSNLIPALLMQLWLQLPRDKNLLCLQPEVITRKDKSD